VDFGSGSDAAKVQSDNKIQLKFSTDEFTGEIRADGEVRG
jgi:hypothetical protein